MRIWILVMVIVLVGCGAGQSDRIDLEDALRNTENGEYSLIVAADEMSWVSFQKSAEHKRQYVWEEGEREQVLKKVSAAIIKARKNGHYVDAWEMEDFVSREGEE